MLRSPRPSSSRAHPPHALHHTHNYAYHLQRTPGTTHENAVILTSPALRVELRPEMNPCRPFHNRWVPQVSLLRPGKPQISTGPVFQPQPLGAPPSPRLCFLAGGIPRTPTVVLFIGSAP